jgi:peptide-methionine (S)-S-oxide reductase
MRRCTILILAAALLLGAASGARRGKRKMDKKPAASRTETAMFGAGCFWCSEAVFGRLKGVRSATPGYAGGTVADPTYKQVCSGTTGHAEVVRVTFDPEVVSYRELLDLFWRMHDPTTPNRQGADVGTQYRSVIFTFSEAQKKSAEAARAALARSGRFKSPIVTQIVPAAPFYRAEEVHLDYYRRNPEAPYCRAVIAPKLKKLGMEK